MMQQQFVLYFVAAIIIVNTSIIVFIYVDNNNSSLLFVLPKHLCYCLLTPSKPFSDSSSCTPTPEYARDAQNIAKLVFTWAREAERHADVSSN
jgi:hypothetical protein